MVFNFAYVVKADDCMALSDSSPLSIPFVRPQWAYLVSPLLELEASYNNPTGENNKQLEDENLRWQWRTGGSFHYFATFSSFRWVSIIRKRTNNLGDESVICQGIIHILDLIMSTLLKIVHVCALGLSNPEWYLTPINLTQSTTKRKYPQPATGSQIHF